MEERKKNRRKEGVKSRGEMDRRWSRSGMEVEEKGRKGLKNREMNKKRKNIGKRWEREGKG